LGEYDFASLYQQRPFLKGGNVFKESPARFNLVDHNMAGWRISITCDLAASQKRTADYTVFQVWAHCGAGDNRTARVLEVRRGQWGIERIAQVALELQRKYGVILAIESVASQIAVVNFIQRTGVKTKLLNPSRMGDKFARAQPAAAAWNADRIEVPLEAVWEGCTVLEYLTEHSQFTGAGDAHDDLVDTTAYNWLEGEMQHRQTSTPGTTNSSAQTSIRR
jgi:predicted phage terminase large subunit-like protein